MDLKQALPDTVSLFHEDVEWIQLIDYEHVPFRCRKCHDLGHLYRDCPLNRKPSVQTDPENPTPDGFTKVLNRRRGNKKSAVSTKIPPVDQSKPSTSNSFEALANEDMQDPDNTLSNEKGISQEKIEGSQSKTGEKGVEQEGNHLKTVSNTWSFPEMDIDGTNPNREDEKESDGSYQEPQIMEEDMESIDIGELDILGLEQACKTGNFDKIPDRQVDNLVAVLNKAQKKYSLGVQIGSQWDGKFITKDSKKRGRKTTLERTIKIGEVLVESGRYAKLTRYFNANPKPSQ